MNTYSSKQFHYDPEDMMFSVEASELARYPFARIYPDACDEGFVIRSAKTGKEVTYYIDHVEKDKKENEIKFWLLRPIEASIKKVPTARGTKVIVFND